MTTFYTTDPKQPTTGLGDDPERQSEKYSVQILRQAIDLQLKKSHDYQNPNSSVKQADYYPHGVWSILDTIKAKYLRMVSVLEAMEAGGSPNFESVQDSCVDLINYASFLAAYLEGAIDGQDPKRDIFNKPTINSSAPIPRKFMPIPVPASPTGDTMKIQLYNSANDVKPVFTSAYDDVLTGHGVI